MTQEELDDIQENTDSMEEKLEGLEENPTDEAIKDYERTEMIAIKTDYNI